VPTSSPTTVIELVRRSFSTLTPTEKKVAHALMARYPAAGLTGVSELALESKTSTASVVRLVQKLGFDGFASFHAALLSELSTREAGPRQRLASAVDPESGILSGLSTALAHSVASIADTVPAAEYEAAVALLTNPQHRITMVGGRVSQAWAEMFATYIARARRDVSVLSRDPGRRTASLLDLSSKHVLVAFDFRRYDDETVKVVETAHQRHAKVILVTDLWLSPAASYADIVLPVPVDVPSPFDTSLTALALVECLTWSIVQQLGPAGAERMREWDGLALHAQA
jgi:DNA-binding MurR/RpiR family transcriptional regulator